MNEKKYNIKIVIFTFVICLIINICFFNNLQNKYVSVAKSNINTTKNTYKTVNNNLPLIVLKYKNNETFVDFSNKKFSVIREKFFSKGISYRIKAMNFALNNGFTLEQSIKYSFPEVIEKLEELEENFNVKEKDACLSVIKNSGKSCVINEESGCLIDKNAFFNDFFNKINNISEKIVFNLQCLNLKPKIIKEDVNNELRGSFKTYFGNSTNSRKNNIKIALSKFDGLILNPNESLSFNNTTGFRNEKSGYQKAKIIKNGSFYEEFGGGVCQVSTTIYNACLLADLEIIEVHAHSLPVSYVEPSFDAMVNMGSSDLIIKNNTDFPVVFATSNKDNFCLVNIYGVKNDYKILRKSVKDDDRINFEKEITSDYKKYGLSEPLKVGEKRVISYGKEGYKAKGKLEYYKNDVLIKTKNIRSDFYKPTKEVILVALE